MYDIPWTIIVIGWTTMFVTYSITKLKTHRCGGGIYTMEVPIAHKQKWIVRALIFAYFVIAGLLATSIDFANLNFFFRQFGDFFVLHGILLFMIAIALYVDSRVTISSNCTWSGGFKYDRHQLIQRGPYKRIRHPQPLSYFLSLVATSFISHDASIFLFAALLIPIAYVKAMIDETYLYFVFPEYEEYVKKTGRFTSK